MLEFLENYLRSNAPFTNDEVAQILAAASPRKVRKKQMLLMEGQVCRHKIFICKGLLRCYQLSDNGSEHIMRFGAENSWMIDPSSYNKQEPSRFNIDTIENSQLLLLGKEEVDKIMIDIPRFREFSEQIRSDSFEAVQKRVLANISYTTEEKYNDFIASYPDVFDRIPLHMVASYLGVSRETLTRLRSSKPRLL